MGVRYQLMKLWQPGCPSGPALPRLSCDDAIMPVIFAEECEDFMRDEHGTGQRLL